MPARFRSRKAPSSASARTRSRSRRRRQSRSPSRSCSPARCPSRSAGWWAIRGCAGAVYAPLVQFIEPNSFARGLSLNLLLIVIVGGSGYFLGPFAGGLVAILAPEWLRFTEGYYLLIYALLVMVLMAICPTGLI